jgi:hypothetical protein
VARTIPYRGRQIPGSLPLLGAALALTACAALAPLRTPPLDPGEAIELVETREEAERRFGPPQAIRSSDLGPVLVYRRAVVWEQNPNRYYGEDRDDRLNRYEHVLLYIGPDGRIIRRAIEPE